VSVPYSNLSATVIVRLYKAPLMSFFATLELPNDSAFLAAARRWSTIQLDSHSVSSHDQDDVRAIIGELCGNVITHAGLKPEVGYRLDLCFSSHSLAITVTDTGTGMKRKVLFTPDRGWEGRRGLMMVGLLSNRLEYLNTDGIGTSIRVHKVYTSLS
jgi:anti-sigma regulatory factor (Ser/Thr protein kinase)